MMKFKVLIADDERVIREGMAALIDWDKLGFEVCCKATNGIEALAMIEEHRPNLLLVDIQMPLLNGLQLIEKAREAQPDLLFIIISGHDEFDFARKAINLGVRDYLLKPVKETLLYDSINKIRNELLLKARQQSQYNFAMSQLQKNMTVLRDQFLQQLIIGQFVQEEVDEMLAFHELQHGFTHFCLLRIDRTTSGFSMTGEWDRHLLRFAMQNIFEEKLSECGNMICTADNQSNLFALLRIDRQDQWQNLSTVLMKVFRETLGIEIRLDKACFGEDWTLITDYYQEWVNEQIRPLNRLTERAVAYLELHFGDPELSFRRLCEALFVSSSYLSKIFKQDTGETFVDYLTKIRIQKALQLLANPALRMYEVANMTGYKSQHYFSAAFKRILGVTPSEYRARSSKSVLD
ncbi:MAG: response regulator [Eubacteriales bacterium]|nr:response regulator [Eubacteriales bacterium]